MNLDYPSDAPGPFTPPPAEPPRKRRSIGFIIVVVLHVILIGGAILIYLAALAWAKQGAGSEFLILVFSPLFVSIPLLFLFDSIWLVIYLIRKKPTGPKRWLSYLWIVVAAAVLLPVILSIAGSFKANADVPAKTGTEMIANCQVHRITRENTPDGTRTILSMKDSTAGAAGMVYSAAGNFAVFVTAAKQAKPGCGEIEYLDATHQITNMYISLTEAKTDITSCKLNGFNYNLTGPVPDGPVSGADTGIVLRDAEPYFQISITDPTQLPALLPAAQAATKTCPGFYVYDH